MPLDHWLDWPIKLLLWLALLVGLLMMLHIAIDVAGRVIFNQPLSGTTEIVSAYYMVAVAYLPLAWIARKDDHIVVELFTRKVSGRSRLYLDIFTHTVTLAYISFFAWQTSLAAMEETHVNEQWESAHGFIMVWPSRWLLPVSAFMMAAYLLLRIIRDVVIARSDSGDPQQP